MTIGLWEYDRQVILAAVILDLLIGDPRWFPHPVVYIGRLIEALEKALRRLVRNERLGGVLLLIMTVGITCGVAVALLKGAYAVSPYMGFGVAVLLSWSCLAARSLHRESRLVADALGRGDLATARRRLSFIVGRDTAGLGEPEVWRATVETVAENTSDGVIAPLFYLIIGGPILALAYKAVNTLDSMVGYRNERYKSLGWASARCDDLANFMPARLTGCSWSLPRRCSDFRRGMHGGSCAATGATTPPPTAASPKRPLPGRSASDSAGPASTPVSGWRSRPSVIH